MTQPLHKPTYRLTFLLAAPGSLQPVSVNSDVKPATFADLDKVIQKMAADLQVAPQFIVPIGVIELLDEPFVDPNSPAKNLLVPNGKLIVPGRD